MDLFKKLASVLDGETTVTIAVRKVGDKLVVSTSFLGKNTEGLTPFVLKGSAEQMDQGYVEQIDTPIEAVNELVSNAKAFSASVEAAKVKTAKKVETPKKEDAKKETPAKEEPVASMKKAVVEAAAKAKVVADIVEMADGCVQASRFYSAVALYGKAMEMSTDAKQKDALKKKMDENALQKASFFCEDDEAAAQAVLDDVDKKIAAAGSAPVAEDMNGNVA